MFRTQLPPPEIRSIALDLIERKRDRDVRPDIFKETAGDNRDDDNITHGPIVRHISDKYAREGGSVIIPQSTFGGI